jgi:hypothetical protein
MLKNEIAYLKAGEVILKKEELFKGCMKRGSRLTA